MMGRGQVTRHNSRKNFEILADQATTISVHLFHNQKPPIEGHCDSQVSLFKQIGGTYILNQGRSLVL